MAAACSSWKPKSAQPKGTSLHVDCFNHFVEIGLPEKILELVTDFSERSVGFKTLFALLDLALPCSDSFEDHDA